MRTATTTSKSKSMPPKVVADKPIGFTPQMYALLQTISEAKKTELDSKQFTAQDLVALAVKKGYLSTCQDPLRIFRFYKDRLVSEGFLSEV